MARRLTIAEREEKGTRAYELSAQSWSERCIAEELGINRHTVSRLIKEERERQREKRDAAADDAIAVYEEVKRHAWKRLTGENLKANSYSVSALLNNIIAAQKAADGITGAEAPKSGSGDVNVSVSIDNRRPDYSNFTEEELRAHREYLAKLRDNGRGRERLLPHRN